MGRPPGGTRHVDTLAATESDKQRLRVILQVIGGQKSIEEACRVLGVGPARLHQLRQQALQAALDGLRPGRAGRPPRANNASDERVRQLEEQIAELEEQLQAALVRTELALAMPHVLKHNAPRPGKKNSSRRKRSRR